MVWIEYMVSASKHHFPHIHSTNVESVFISRRKRELCIHVGVVRGCLDHDLYIEFI